VRSVPSGSHTVHSGPRFLAPTLKKSRRDADTTSMRDATFRPNQRSRWLRWFFPLIGICWGLISADRVQAYDNDVHYVFTYYLARKLGYTRSQAHQVASADVSVDLDEHTEPLQKKAVGSLHESAQPPRIKFHAFRDSRLIEKIIANETAKGKSWADAQA